MDGIGHGRWESWQIFGFGFFRRPRVLVLLMLQSMAVALDKPLRRRGVRRPGRGR